MAKNGEEDRSISDLRKLQFDLCTDPDTPAYLRVIGLNKLMKLKYNEEGVSFPERFNLIESLEDLNIRMDELLRILSEPE